jgi:hypothetical protein
VAQSPKEHFTATNQVNGDQSVSGQQSVSGNQTVTGVQYVNNNSFVKTDLIFNGGNNWIIHTPDDQRTLMFIAPSATYGREDWDWGRSVRIEKTDARLYVNKVQLGNKFLLSGVGDFTANDSWLRMMGVDEKGYYGGFAAGAFWSGSSYATSDIKLKQDIQDISAEDIDDMLKLKAKSYEMKDEPGKKRFGFIAQEVEMIYPDMVTSMDGTKGICYTDIIPLLVAKIQTMDHTIRELKKKLEICEHKLMDVDAKPPKN